MTGMPAATAFSIEAFSASGFAIETTRPSTFWLHRGVDQLRLLGRVAVALVGDVVALVLAGLLRRPS